MKNFLRAFVFVLLGSTAVATAQTVEVKVKNQRIVGTEFFFDVYLEKTAGDTVLLGYSDIVITNLYPAANWSSPAINYVTGSNNFKNNAGASLTTDYNSKISTSLGTGANANRIIINLDLGDFDENTPGDALAKLAIVKSSDTTVRIGTFRITGLNNTNSFYPNADFHTSGAGIKVKIYKIATYGSYTQTRITETAVSTQSVLGTAPTSGQLAGIALTKDGAGSSPTSVKIDWTGVAAANGDSLLIIARSTNGGASASDSTPGNSLAYAANNDWSAKTNNNRIGTTPWYVVYKGTSANGSVTISNISNTETYLFRAVPYDGVDGYSSAYASQADLHANNATVQLQTTPTATEPTNRLAAITLTTNQGNPDTRLNFTVDTTGIFQNPGDSVIVLAKASSILDTTDRPVDGNYYASSADFSTAPSIGNAKVVFRGLATAAVSSVEINGLTANTRYYFEAIIFRGTGAAGSQNYKTDTTAWANRYTTPAPINPAVAANQSRDITFTAFGVTSIDLSWTNGTAGNGTIIIAREAGAVNATPTQGTYYNNANSDIDQAVEIGTSNYVVYSGTGTSVSVTNLNPNQRYHFAAVRYIGDINNPGNINYIQDGGGSNWGRGDDNTYMNVTARASLEGSMDTLLKTSSNVIPLTQPFNTAAYNNYAGAESVASIPNGVVDWVLIELRRTTTGDLADAGPSSVPSSGATLVARRAAFLKNDGSIVGTNGTDTALTFNIENEGRYFIVVSHRNHLPIMSASANVLGKSIYVNGDGTADLTVAANVAGTAGTNFLVDAGVVKMWSGNADPADLIIDADDRAVAWSNKNLVDVYDIADVDLDRETTARDRSFIWNNRDKEPYAKIGQN